jgi:PAS domain S-box-containing protein
MKTPLRVLHLEDDARDAELIHETLAADGIVCDVIRVETPEDFVASVERDGWDLILADYTLPSFDGLSALTIAQARSAHLPFIFVSGTLDEEAAIEALKVGAEDYVLKTRLSRLVPSVRRALREAEKRAELARAEAALRRSEAYLAEAQRLSHTGSFGWDVGSGRIYWSQETFRILGYEPGSTITIDDVVRRTHPDDAAFVRQVIERASRERQEFDVEHRLLLPDGSIKHVQVVGHPATGDSGAFEFVGAVTDVTGRRQAEQALRDSERNSRLIVDNIPGLVALLTATGDVEVVNRRLFEYFGQTLEELRHWGTNDTIHPEDLPHVIDHFGRAIVSGSPYEIVQRFRRADGVYRWFTNSGFPVRDLDGRISRWCVLLTDIDERKRAEDAQRESERESRLIVDSIPGFVAAFTPGGEVEFVNRQTREYFGKSLEEMKHWGAGGLTHPEDLPRVVELFTDAISSGSPFDFELRARRFDGVYRWFRSRGFPLHDTNGQIVRWYNLLIDIDEHKRAEEALDKARSDLAYVARVTTVSALTASMAHEINQPLTGIITNAGTCLRLLDTQPPDLDGVRETATRMIRDVNRAAEVIARLRALFTKQDFTLEPLDLNVVTREIIALTSIDLQRDRVAVKSELADDLPIIDGDRIQLQQVILNLIRNASDAMHDVHDRARELVIKTEREGADHVRLSVRDAGVGIDRENIDKLFMAFHTTKPGGMGIGLSISRSIVERHHGRVWAEANDGPGTTFSFSIPLTGQRST